MLTGPRSVVSALVPLADPPRSRSLVLDNLLWSFRNFSSGVQLSVLWGFPTASLCLQLVLELKGSHMVARMNLLRDTQEQRPQT